MISIYSFLGLLFLILIQVSIIPINLAFMSIFAFSLYLENFAVFVWLVVAAVLLALFANLNVGFVMLSFLVVYLVLFVSSKIMPNNQLAKVSLVLFSLFLTEVVTSFVYSFIG